MHKFTLICMISFALLPGCNVSEVTPPIIISSIQLSAVSETTATINFTTREQAVARIDYVDNDYYTANAS